MGGNREARDILKDFNASMEKIEVKLCRRFELLAKVPLDGPVDKSAPSGHDQEFLSWRRGKKGYRFGYTTCDSRLEVFESQYLMGAPVAVRLRAQKVIRLLIEKLEEGSDERMEQLRAGIVDNQEILKTLMDPWEEEEGNDE